MGAASGLEGGHAAQRRRRWLARLSILLIAGSIAVLVEFAGLRSIGLVGVGALGTCVVLAGGYLFAANRGLARGAAMALVVAGPVVVLALYARHGLLWVAIAAAALAMLAVIVGRVALSAGPSAMSAEHRAERPKRAFVIMNPRSGGGKVARFKLKEKAEALGAEVAVLDAVTMVDVAELARRAVAEGADLLAVAAGDGTQALVAGVAAEYDVPFVCISAGTRNHFAMDLGLDRADPSGCLDALTDGVEYKVDLGRIGDRTFVNNASFGVYAEIVRSPAYRDDKRGTILDMLPSLLKDEGGNRLSVCAGDRRIEGPQALLVSNNAYEMTDFAGLGRRGRLDGGSLGVIAITIANAAQAISLVRRGRGRGLTLASAAEVIVDAVQPQIPVGVDGELVMMPTPVRCQIMPKALRVVVPRVRPGTPAVRPAFSWFRLAHLAWFGPWLTPPGPTAR